MLQKAGRAQEEKDRQAMNFQDSLKASSAPNGSMTNMKIYIPRLKPARFQTTNAFT